MKLTWPFSSRSMQKSLLISAVAVGAAGLLSGFWLAAEGDLTSLAGLVGGAVTLAIGWSGLHRLSHSRPT